VLSQTGVQAEDSVAVQAEEPVAVRAEAQVAVRAEAPVAVQAEAPVAVQAEAPVVETVVVQHHAPVRCAVKMHPALATSHALTPILRWVCLPVPQVALLSPALPASPALSQGHRRVPACRTVWRPAAGRAVGPAVERAAGPQL
jgi:hypothetical protein